MPDLVVVGAGHAGCEAALAAARMGISTLLLTLNMDGVALMACNPVIGGTAKGHLVRELDALGGEMGRAIDDTFLQSRMLNTAKGPAVHSLRAQADKQAYQNRMRQALMSQPHLTLRQGEVDSIETENGRGRHGIQHAAGYGGPLGGGRAPGGYRCPGAALAGIPVLFMHGDGGGHQNAGWPAPLPQR